MGDDFNWHTYEEGRQPGIPTDPSEQNPRPRGPNSGRVKAASWASKLVAALQGNALLSALRKHLPLTVILVLLLVPVGAVILGYITRPAPGTASRVAGLTTNSSDNNTSEKIPKPAPGKPLLSTSQAPQPALSSPAPPPALPDQPPSGLTTVPPRPLTPAPAVPNPAPNAAAPPASTPAQPYTPMVYSARHDKHFGDSCSGQLTLDSSGLMFKCPDDPGGSVQVALADIEAVDSNGIRLTSGKKYHFSIAGMAKDSVQALFANWLSHVR